MRLSLLVASCIPVVSSFQLTVPTTRSHPAATTVCHAEKDTTPKPREDNKAMAFLRKVGRVGGAANVDFSNVMGVDEGPAGKTSSGGGTKTTRKAKSGYKSVEVDGMIDDLSEPFPVTSSGTQWAGFTDQVMGGRSSGSITRETLDGQLANVLRGKVSLENNGGFVQMATDLALDPSVSRTVDMSNYDGVELNVMYLGDQPTEEFNVHLKNEDCLRQFSSYRGTFSLTKGEWTYVRLPWSDFKGKGPGAEDKELDVTTLRRIGIVAIGREMEVTLGVSGVGFYCVF